MSAAVGDERKSATNGYAMIGVNFNPNSPNLPAKIGVLTEANTANQITLDTGIWEMTSLKEVGVRYGYGSPAYHIARIAKKVIGGIPLIFYPQAEAPGATAKILDITPVGTVTENTTHTVVISGRHGIDGQFYNFPVVVGDTNADLVNKIKDCINVVLGAPCSATNNPYAVRCTSKWKGKTANDLNISIDTRGKDAGMTYTITNISNGAGVSSIADTLALESFIGPWNTHIINGYGTDSDIMDALEQFNGIPDPIAPTGRYRGIIMKPFRAYTGCLDEDPSNITDARKEQVTIKLSPAPKSKGFAFEAAANDCALAATVAQNTPHLDVMNMAYLDMPTPDDIGAMSDYEERDRMVKKGCATVELAGGRYVIKDSVTTYHPEGELNPQFMYDRDLTVAFNIRFGYMILELENVSGYTIAADNDPVNAPKVVKPKTWKRKLFTYTDDLVSRALITEPDFTKESLTVNKSTTNANRLETFFRVKFTSIARISSTEVEMGFNFG